ncbi:aminopeptidase N-like isoform X1 [Teleopsis dalmanni]|uniref:aminopeptidase N-like isoform X1 n=2 Tax=Teleopsis dalmanni TaxID=139649 RepID=UPI0018CF1BCD|nr:aminopeptidase N-like isoform X1 [Teleopsis dalmanni]
MCSARLNFHTIGNTVLILIIFIGFSAGLRPTNLLKTTDNTTRQTPRRSLRLPNSTFPLHYDLHINTSIHLEDFVYIGNVTIDIEIRESTNEIVMHAKNLSDFEIIVYELPSGDVVTDLTHSYDPFSHFLIIHPIQRYVAFEAGQLYRVQILFKGLLHSTTYGFYWFSYNDQNNRTVYQAATQCEPTSARLAFPCYDEPAFKSNFTIHLTHSDIYTSISNMPVRQLIRHDESNLVTTSFYPTPPMSTYLVAFVISNFEYISEEYRNVTQRIFTSPTIEDKGHNALKNAVRVVAQLEDYFGIKYSLSKLDHIALNKNYGAAMENWGLITYKEDTLVHQNDADVHKKLKDILTQNHEIVHQWFGNLVSPEWWTYAWINEGFATYFAYILTDLLYPEYKVMDFFLTDIAERAYGFNFISVRPMTYYVETESEIISIFDIISYQRAACVIKMFHHAFDQKTFLRGINRFLRKYQYTVANELKLFEALQAEIAEDEQFGAQSWSKSISDIMLSWTHSEWIPIVTVKRNYDDNTITITQRSNDLHSQEYWWIPINFAIPKAYDFERTSVDYFMPPTAKVTLSIEDLNLDLERYDWLIVNKQQTGFYHVHYDTRNLLNIAKQLQADHNVIHPLNRAAIFQDLCPLIENNELESVDVIFELLKYLEHEEHLIPWNFVADTVIFFDKNLFGTAAHARYKQFIRRIIAPIFKQLFGTHVKANLTNTDLQTRQKVLDMACMADLKECLDFTHGIAHNYMFGHIKLMADMDYYAMHDSILCLGLKYLDDSEFNQIMDLLAKTDKKSLFYDDLIYSLRCTQNKAHLQQYLDLLIGEHNSNSIMNDSDSMMYFFYLYKVNMASRSVVWRFFEQNYKKLCHSQYFAENFNRIAEYIPQRHRDQFMQLRQDIIDELQTNNIGETDTLINTDSNRIGKRVKLSEVFVEKFHRQIHDWLKREQNPSVYAAASISGGSRNHAPQLKFSLHMVTKIFKRILQLKL